MNEKISVKVKCHHSGEFKLLGGVLDYVGGVVEEIEVDSITIFEDVLIYMLEKRIKHIGKMWYKLPFEDISDRKPLWENVDANKKKLISKGRWMKEVDIYFEKEGEECVEAVDTIAVGKENACDGALILKENVCDDDEGQSSEEALSESSESEVDGDIGDEETEIEEEDIQVFNHENYKEQIPDEDDVYPATDDESGDEEAQTEKLVRRGVVDGVFSLRQVFSSGIDFKRNVIKYVLKTRRNVVYDRWENERLGARCKAKGCGWKIYCAVEIPLGGKWMVKTYDYDHQCHPTGRCEIIKTPVIADLFLEDIRRDPEMSGPEIKDEMKRKYNIIISPNQAKVARRRVFDKLQAECDEQFARLRDYELHLITSNLHTTVEVNTTVRADGREAFHQIYICFEPLRTAWKQNCRPIIGLDGTFLKNSTNGMMLTAVGRDPNNQIFPVAWAVVDCENNPNWEWFVRKLKEDLDLGLGENITLISDMHKGLIHGVSTVLPMAEHQACARHIYSNLKKSNKANMLKPLFWRVASSYNEADYNANLAIFKEFDPQACATLLQKDRTTWCRAFFRVGCCCADTHNNHTESYNRTLKIARRKPFVQMLELIRRDAMQQVAIRSTIAGKETAKYTKKARKELEKSCDEAQYCAMITSTGGEYEIVEFGTGYFVNLSARTCACRKWDLTGIPCRHAVCAIREMNYEVEDYISHYYLTEKWQGTYRRGLRPVNGSKFWKDSGRPRIVAPPYKRPAGRPKGKARIKGLNESPSKKKSDKKVGRQGRVVQCGLYGQAGHNSRRCPNESSENRAKRRKLNAAPQLEAQDQAEMEAAFAAMEAPDHEPEPQVEPEVQDVSSSAPQRRSFVERMLFG